MRLLSRCPHTSLLFLVCCSVQLLLSPKRAAATMGDWGLEDKMLRRNIPGRYGTWASDDDDTRDDDEDDAASVPDDPEPEPEESRAVPEALRYGEAPAAAGKTGVKATLAQYRYFKKMQRAEILWNKVDREAKLLAVANGVVRDAPPPPPPPRKDPDARTESASSESDDDDDEFLESYRRKRLAQLKAEKATPTFGAFHPNATKQEYLDALATRDAVVVVHLHEPNYGPCRRLNGALAALAARRRDVRFLGLALGEAGEALQGYDVETLPTLVVYQHGEVVETLFRVGSDLAPSYDAADVESLLDTVPAFAGDGPVAPPPPARPVCDARRGPPPRVD